MKDLSGDGKITKKDVLIGRGVLEKPMKKNKGGSIIKRKSGGLATRGYGAAKK